YFIRRATANTRSRVSALTSGWLLMARETVIFETPNSRAMSASVVGISRLSQHSVKSIKPENFRQRLEIGRFHRPDALLPKLIERVFGQRGARRFIIIGLDIHK